MQLSKWATVAVGAVMLGGCAGAEVILAVAQVVQITTLAGGAYEVGKEVSTVQYRVQHADKERETWDDQLDFAKTVTFGRVWWREDGKCTFEGVVVPWTAVVDPAAPAAGSTAQPSAPASASASASAQIAGYASVIYRKQCPEQAEQQILLAGKQDVFRRKNKTTVANHQAVQTMDVMTDPAQARPVWWPQVVQRLLDLAPRNPDALRFVQQSQENLIQLMPEQEAAIRAAAQPALAAQTEQMAQQ